MIFRQLFEPESSTYTYLFGCRDTPSMRDVTFAVALGQLGMTAANVRTIAISPTDAVGLIRVHVPHDR